MSKKARKYVFEVHTETGIVYVRGRSGKGAITVAEGQGYKPLKGQRYTPKIVTFKVPVINPAPVKGEAA